MKVLILTIFCHCVLAAWGWGAIGHRLVVRLAQSKATGYTPFWLAPMIPMNLSGDLSVFASWADTILNLNANSPGYINWGWTRPYHYLNTPDWNCSFDAARDCVGDVCVAAAIRNYTERLKTVQDLTERKYALYFLIHYVGDIHQPLHTAFSGDVGGNRIRGYFRGSRTQTNLHSLWDTGMISYRLQSKFSSNETSYFEYLKREMSNLDVNDAENLDIDYWIKQNLKNVCDGIYNDENEEKLTTQKNFTLGIPYFNRNIEIVEKQLVRGGARLGHILNELANDCGIKLPKDEYFFL